MALTMKKWLGERSATSLKPISMQTLLWQRYRRIYGRQRLFRSHFYYFSASTIKGFYANNECHQHVNPARLAGCLCVLSQTTAIQVWINIKSFPLIVQKAKFPSHEKLSFYYFLLCNAKRLCAGARAATKSRNCLLQTRRRKIVFYSQNFRGVEWFRVLSFTLNKNISKTNKHLT